MGGLSKKIKWTYAKMAQRHRSHRRFSPLAGASLNGLHLGAGSKSRRPSLTLSACSPRCSLRYTVPLIFLTFHGKQRYDEHHVQYTSRREHCSATVILAY